MFANNDEDDVAGGNDFLKIAKGTGNLDSLQEEKSLLLPLSLTRVRKRRWLTSRQHHLSQCLTGKRLSVSRQNIRF